MSAKALANETASESMAPGGGSIAAYVGALGTSLATMVANLSANKPGWEYKLDYFSEIAVQGQAIKNELLHLVDEDTRSFNGIIDAIRLPKDSDEEKKIRKDAIEKASQYAAEVPYKVMQVASRSTSVIKEMIDNGNPNSITDAGVGALCTKAAIGGAYMNVQINLKDLSDRVFAIKLAKDATALKNQVFKDLDELSNRVYQAIES